MSEASRQPVSTFSMGFDDGSYNELPYAREVAALVRDEPSRADRHARISRSCSTSWSSTWTSRSPTSRCFRLTWCRTLAREHVTVALSGDGGDELFGGYDAYEAQALAARLGGLGDALMPALAARGGGAAADREEEGAGQQGQALHGRRGAPRRAISVTTAGWCISGRGAKERLYARGLARARCRRPTSTRPVRDALARFGAGRSAEPPAVCRPERLPRRRHPREGRSDEHGDVARDPRAVSRRRRHGARVLDARPPQDPQRRAQVGAEAGDARRCCPNGS